MARKNTYISKSPEDTNRLAKEFVENLLKTRGKTGGKPVKKATIVTLQGDLGAGKTTFVKAVAQTLGIKKTLTSPTFVLEKVYKIPSSRRNLTDITSARFRLDNGFTHLIHIDAYRLENGAELLTLGWKGLIEDPRNLIFVEWPERVVGAIPKGVKKTTFTFIDERTRKITL